MFSFTYELMANMNGQFLRHFWYVIKIISATILSSNHTAQAFYIQNIF